MTSTTRLVAFALFALCFFISASAAAGPKKLKDKDLSKAVLGMAPFSQTYMLRNESGYQGQKTVELATTGQDRTVRIDDEVFINNKAVRTSIHTTVLADGTVTIAGAQEAIDNEKSTVFVMDLLYVAASALDLEEGSSWDGLIYDSTKKAVRSGRLLWADQDSARIYTDSGDQKVAARRIEVLVDDRNVGVLYVSQNSVVAFDSQRDSVLSFNSATAKAIETTAFTLKSQAAKEQALRDALYQAMSAYERGNNDALLALVDLNEIARRIAGPDDLLYESIGIWTLRMLPIITPAAQSEAVLTILDSQLRETADNANLRYEDNIAYIDDLAGHEARLRWNGERWQLIWWDGFKTGARFLGK